MKLKAKAPKGSDPLMFICHEPFARLEVWIDEISKGTETIENIHRETYYRWFDTEHAAMSIWAKLALEFSTPAANGDPLPPFQLRAFVDAVQESLHRQDEENNWVRIPDMF